MAQITVSKLSAFYENKEIFKNLSFTVNKGDYLCVIGENGSGKTTLMRCILGFDVKHTGSITFNGITRKEIGWLPQRTELKKDFPASVYEVVLSGFSGTKLIISKKDKKRAEKNLKLLEIENLKNRPFKELSGGQQQKVLLCRALCSASSVLLLDEPVTGLDSTSQNEMYSLIRKLNKSGMTVIMISHDVERAVIDANKILRISDDGYYFGNSKEDEK
ncbi:MAG: metal ABC transporter ATP-binding protein [Clostridia bacterium]|nr:metal ABC transporter ATP-binding protein [Clostridia bacterium]